MRKNDLDFVFVILTYRNIKDLVGAIENIHKNTKGSKKIIVVNSYFDEKSKKSIQKIAIDNECDFLNIENKGYGYGNNKGIEFARDRYKFKFLVVCNPDTIINQLRIEDIISKGSFIIAPNIKNLRGKNQNPYYFKKSNFKEYILYKSYIKDMKKLALISNVIGRLQREIALLKMSFFSKKMYKVYASHGSFVIFSNDLIQSKSKIYDDNIFLFSEENDLARYCFSQGIPTYYVPSIKITHKEDGSMGFVSESLISYKKKSFVYYYKKWNS